MDYKTLVESHDGEIVSWDFPDGGLGYTFREETLWDDRTDYGEDPIAYPRSLKAARQILKEAGWTILQSRQINAVPPRRA